VNIQLEVTGSNAVFSEDYKGSVWNYWNGILTCTLLKGHWRCLF